MHEGEGALAVVTLVAGSDEVVLGRIVDVRPDLALVDVLARLQLVARRFGQTILLREVCPQLRELLDLAGLADLVAGPD